VAVALACALSLCRLARAAVPSKGPWQQVAAEIVQRWQPGDALVVTPAWMAPLARLHLAALRDADDPTRMDLAAASRAWVVMRRDEEGRAAAVLLANGFAATASSWASAHGDLRVARYDQAPVRVIDRVVDHVASTLAEVGEVAGLGYAPRRCVQLTPPAGGETELVIGMSLGTQLVGYVGLADVFTRREIRVPGALRIERVLPDGTRQRLVSQAVGVDDGWVRFATATEPGPARLAFVARSPDAGGRGRQVCFAAEARQ